MQIRFSLFAFIILCLSACGTPPKGEPIPLLTFDHIQPIAINVLAVEASESHQSESQAFFMSPADGVQNYLQARFDAKGVHGALAVDIEEAGVTKNYVGSKKGVQSYLGVDGVDEYAVTIRVRLAHHDAYGGVPHNTTLTVQRKINISEHASLAERDRRQLEGMEALFRDLDREVQRVVLENMRLGLY